MNHCRMCNGFIPTVCNLQSRPLYHTRSNALLISQNIARTFLPCRRSCRITERFTNIAKYCTHFFTLRNELQLSTRWFTDLVSRDNCVALPHGAMGLCAVFDCGIS